MVRWYQTGHDHRFFSHPNLPRTMMFHVDDNDDTSPLRPYVFNEVAQGDAFALSMAAFQVIAWQLDWRELKGKLLEKAIRFSSGKGVCSLFKPTTDQAEQMSTFVVLIREYLRWLRPWYRHPRWHFWHWQIQIPVMQSVKRWLFSRCCKCKRRFPFGSSVGTDQWDGPGPRWFRGERGVYHMDCAHPKSDGAKMVPSGGG